VVSGWNTLVKPGCTQVFELDIKVGKPFNDQGWHQLSIQLKDTAGNMLGFPSIVT
jgi:hypothetical protein